jgi:hypothetical protein
MKSVILEWNPKIGDQSLEVIVSFVGKHIPLATIVATKQTMSWKPFPGFYALPETTEQERDLVETHVRTYYDAFFRLVKETTIWYDETSTVEARIQKSI